MMVNSTRSSTQVRKLNIRKSLTCHCQTQEKNGILVLLMIQCWEFCTDKKFLQAKCSLNLKICERNQLKKYIEAVKISKHSTEELKKELLMRMEWMIDVESSGKESGGKR